MSNRRATPPPTASSQPSRHGWHARIALLACITAMVALALPVAHAVNAGPRAFAASDQHHDQVRRLYLAYFEREPDPAGAAYWQTKRAQGVGIGAISEHFARSSEFRARYGQLDDATFVSLVYRNVLGREPEGGGDAYWRSRLAHGMSRGELMAHFSESAEFRRRTGTGAPTPSPVPGDSASGSFSESFDGNRGLDRFLTGVFHRDLDAQTHGSNRGSWQGDHDITLADCGNPNDNTHTITKAARDDATYVCRDHMMTSMGDVDGYSVVWFSPNRTFNGQRTISWDVNSTYLGTRQWWEMTVIPAGTSRVTCIDFLPCDTAHYHQDAVVVSTRDNSVRVWADGHERNATWETICHSDEYSLDAEGCASKTIRRPWSVTDNGDGTLRVRFHTHEWVVPGRFPAGDFWVVFKDHNYTPLKDGPVAGFTWHWDNIVVR